MGSKRAKRRQNSGLPEPSKSVVPDIDVFSEVAQPTPTPTNGNHEAPPKVTDEVDSATLIDQGIFGGLSGRSAKEVEAENETLRTQLVEAKKNAQQFFQVSSVGVQIDKAASFDDIKQFIESVSHIESATHWMYGDALAFGESRKWGEIYDWAVTLTNKSKQTLENYAWVSRQFPEISERSEKLKYKHYELLAGVKDTKKRQKLMLQAIAERWSTRRLDAEIRSEPLPSMIEKERDRFDARRKRLEKLVMDHRVPRDELEDILSREITMLQDIMSKLKENG
jgi:hypothetical protein